MSRRRREWEPGDILSIVGRAHEGRLIFTGDDDRRFFVDRLRRVFVPGDVDLLAWALLANHYHLMIRVTDVAPSTLLLRLNTMIARRERRRRGDRGAVFQDRFWSGRCTDVGAELALLTYVLGNPVHHGVVETAELLESYPWTAYPEILGLQAPGLVDAPKTLSLLCGDEVAARNALREAMSRRVARWRAAADGADPCEEPTCSGARDVCRLVHPALVRTGAVAAAGVTGSVMASGISRVHDERSIRRARLHAAGWRPSALVVPVCARFGAEPDAVLNGVRRRPESLARAVVAYVACDGVGAAVGEVAALLGVSGPAATAARRRGRALVDAHGWSIDEVLSWTGVETTVG